MPRPVLKSTLIKNIFSLTFLQAANYILPLITVPYLVRVLGPDGFGIIGFAFALIQYFILLTDYGFNLSATRMIALRENDPKNLSTTFSSIYTIKLAFIILSLLLLVLITHFIPQIRLHAKIFYLTFLIVVGNALFPIWLFQGLQEMGHIVWLNLFSKALCTGAIFLFVKSPQSINLAVGLQSSGYILSGVLGFCMAVYKYKIKLVNPGKETIKHQLREGWPIFISTASISLYTNTNIVLLGLLTNETQVGYYSAADKVIKAVQGLTTPVTQAIYPYINRLISQSKESAILFIKKSLTAFGFASILMSICLLLFAEPIVNLILGAGFEQSIILIKIMSPLPLIITISNILGIQTMLPFGLNKEFSRSIIISSIINIALIIPFTSWLLAKGTAASLVITELTVTALMWGYLRKNKIILLGATRNAI
ncbi:flippase [Deltaproteobacteria bacterium PRO3]|nr:flippase [Deltaproteobacteria bacterium PRO3]